MTAPSRRRSRVTGGAAAALLAFGAGTGLTLPASAADVTTADAATGSSAGATAGATAARAGARKVKVDSESDLRDAVEQANASTGLTRIKVRDHVRLRGGQLDVTGDIVVNARAHRIDARGASRIFDVADGGRLVLKQARLVKGAAPTGENGGAIRSAGEVVLRGTTIRASVAEGTGASGGAIANEAGTLLVSGSVLRGNSATRAGGAIEAVEGETTLIETRVIENATGAEPGNGGGLHLTGTGTVSVQSSWVADNTASAEGGGLWSSATGTFTVDRTVLMDNVAEGVAADQGGGALYNDGGALTVTRSSLEGNRATGTAGSGGGILNNLGTLSVERSTLSGNTANRAGGGIEANVGTTTLDGVELSGNDAGQAPGNGGGLHLTGAGTVDVSQSTVTDNTAVEGGGLWNSSGGTLTVRGSSLAGNSASGAEADQGGGAVYSDGGTTEVLGSELTDNSATGAAGSGGGILAKGGSLVVRRSVLDGNDAQRAGGGKGARELLLQIHPVGDHNDPAVLQGVTEEQSPAQIDHGERLTGAGGVPEHAAFALAAGFEVGDALQKRLDPESLRVPGRDFPDLSIEQDEEPQKLQKPVPVEQADQEPILFCGHDRL